MRVPYDDGCPTTVGKRWDLQMRRFATPVIMGLIGVLAATLVALAPPTVASAAAGSDGGGRFTPVDTARVFQGTVGTTPTVIPVAGHGGVASDATAVVVNVEIENPTSAGYVRIMPAGHDAQVATQEFSPGQTISNLATVKLENGAVQVKLNTGSALVFLDVSGYYSASITASTYTPLSNFRLVNQVIGSTPTTVQAAGVGTVPSDATAVVMSVEVQNPTDTGYVRVTPAGQDPQVAVQEFTPGITIANLVTVGLAGGRFQLKLSAGSAQVFVDVAGYYSADPNGSRFVPMSTVRTYAGPVTSTPEKLTLGYLQGVPATAGGVLVNAEVQGTTTAGYLRVTPAGQDAQVAAQEFAAGATISTMLVAALVDRQVQAKVSAGSATLFVDVAGYFTTTSPGTGADVSQPQGTGPYPSGTEFGIVGVNYPLANQTNADFAAERAWAAATSGGTAQPKVQLYVLTANPGPAAASWPTSNAYPSGSPAAANPYGRCTGAMDLACSWMYGYARAYDDANSRGVSSPSSYRWWLDVETGFTYQTGNLAQNVADFEGMTAYFESIGASVGIYSTPTMWSEIAGTVTTASPLYTLPNWVPFGASVAAETAAAKCDSPPLMGGNITMVQYVDTFDYDYSCS
jgi:hypothetical protein